MIHIKSSVAGTHEHVNSRVFDFSVPQTPARMKKKKNRKGSHPPPEIQTVKPVVRGNMMREVQENRKSA
jgi:hypothetical protein